MVAGKGNSGGSWPPEDKKLICGMEGEIVVAHGRLLSSYGCSRALGDVTLGQKTFIYSNGFFQINFIYPSCKELGTYPTNNGIVGI